MCSRPHQPPVPWFRGRLKASKALPAAVRHGCWRRLQLRGIGLRLPAAITANYVSFSLLQKLCCKKGYAGTGGPDWHSLAAYLDGEQSYVRFLDSNPIQLEARQLHFLKASSGCVLILPAYASASEVWLRSHVACMRINREADATEMLPCSQALNTVSMCATLVGSSDCFPTYDFRLWLSNPP